MFSIVIPLYNKASYVLRALKSVKNQSFKKFEVIVVDDGSSDGGPGLVEEEFGDFLTLIRQENKGVSVARNAGIAAAKFDFIAFLDADDFWHQEYLNEMAKGIRDFPASGIWGSSYTYHDSGLSNEHSGFHQINNYFEQAIVNTLFFTSATIVQKSFFDSNQGFNPSLKRGEDLDVWFRVILFFGLPSYCKDRLVYYEKGDEKSATRNEFPVQSSLSSIILKSDYYDFEKVYDQAVRDRFLRFRDKYVYFNIYPYFKDSENHAKINLILSNVSSRFFPITWFFRLPVRFLKSFFSNKFMSRQFRNYLKFCFRFIYI